MFISVTQVETGVKAHSFAETVRAAQPGTLRVGIGNGVRGNRTRGVAGTFRNNLMEDLIDTVAALDRLTTSFCSSLVSGPSALELPLCSQMYYLTAHSGSGGFD